MSHRPICRGCGANRAGGQPHHPDCTKNTKREGKQK